jgi:CheY-like chemotaxis protein
MVMTVIDEVLAADVPATSPLWRRDGPLALLAMTELGGVMSVYEAARKRSWRIVDATNGAQAVGVAMLVQPDCALLDANVATLSGLEVADGLHVYAPRTAVLVLTGDADVDAEARAAGFATLGKSAPLAEILTTMEQLVA